MITATTIHNYFKWLEKEEATALKEVQFAENVLAEISAKGRVAAFTKARKRLSKLLKQ